MAAEIKKHKELQEHYYNLDKEQRMLINDLKKQCDSFKMEIEMLQ